MKAFKVVHCCRQVYLGHLWLQETLFFGDFETFFPISLRSGIESKKYDMERTQAALSKTLNITAYDSARLVGCLRILTDGYFFGTITELLVLPEYQKQGVGSKLLELAKENTLTIEQEIPKWTSCFFVI